MTQYDIRAIPTNSVQRAADLRASKLGLPEPYSLTRTHVDLEAELAFLAAPTGRCPNCDTVAVFDVLNLWDPAVSEGFAGPHFDDPVPTRPVRCGHCQTVVDWTDVVVAIA